MSIKRFLVYGLVLTAVFFPGCVKERDSFLGEAKLTIPRYAINAPAKGKILGLVLEKGEHIGKGQPLFAIASSEIDRNVKKGAEELVKAEAELKRLEIGNSAQITDGDLTAAKERLVKAETNAEKMNRLFESGAVPKKQAIQANVEVDSARERLRVLSEQSGLMKANPETIARQKQLINHIKETNRKDLEKQAAFEALAPNSCIVIEKLFSNGDEVEKDQTILKLLAQDECEVKIKLTLKAVQKVKDKHKNLVFKVKGSDKIFTGRVVSVENDTIDALVKLPNGAKEEIDVLIDIQK